MTRAEIIMEKIAEGEKPEAGYWAKSRAAGRALRERSDGKINKVFTSAPALKEIMKGEGKGILVDAPIGAALGAASEALSGGVAKPGALFGGMLGAAVGGGIGSTLGQRKYLATKGVDLSPMGFRIGLSSSAQAKYLKDKYRGGGYKG